jgi:hypothetical protein
LCRRTDEDIDAVSTPLWDICRHSTAAGWYGRGLLNGPTATGDHCPEGWSSHRLPGPGFVNVPQMRVESSYYTWVVDILPCLKARDSYRAMHE